MMFVFFRRLGDRGERGVRGARVPAAGARRVADGDAQGRRARRQVRRRQPGEIRAQVLLSYCMFLDPVCEV